MTARKTDTSPAADHDGGERIAKRLARAGLCSRRDAERWIAEGRVAVNGQTLASPACVVRPGDLVQVDGKLVPEPEPARLWRYHKPSGLVTTARDEKGRATVFDRLPPELPRVVSVGRLDLTTEGLLLLTNDGELARFLELPTTGWTRRYRVRVFGEVDEVRLAALQKGITIEGVKYGPIEAVLDRIQGRNAWLTVSLKEGKNREIRKVMETLGLQVNRLIRVAYGPFQLGKLEEGAVEEVPRRVVKEQVSRFFTGEEAEEEATPTQQRARARAAEPARTARPEPVKVAPAAPEPAGKAARPPRSAAKRHELQERREAGDDKRRGPAARKTDRPATKPASAKAAEGRPFQGKPVHSRPAPAGKAPPAKPTQAKADQARMTDSRPARAKAGPDRSGPDKSGPRGPKPRGAGPNRPAGGGAAGGARTERPRADRRR
ncbi:pseudouridine synthase [Azospirillum thermophilum]|uniref:Pseudouridine synthase n=1 Tax=Azospirillum thermophilum TaxID=2202148 RepID=A0A2S2CQ61_9PROT|nr:pseudouridine synthase [Azospirillum thermophilum]AWK86663.1 pseudouridine synthase [Azospirillum thermophilum]